ncbi:MAG: metalloregulator ArsR/SmtB family transcription factor [Bacteroidota bacterium]
MRHLAHILKALSDVSRLRILALLLRRGELCVCDIEAATDFTQTKTSRHLSYLRRVGLVKTRREGLWMHYSVMMPRQKEGRMLLNCITKILEHNVTMRGDLKRGEDWLRRKKCCSLQNIYDKRRNK